MANGKKRQFLPNITSATGFEDYEAPRLPKGIADPNARALGALLGVGPASEAPALPPVRTPSNFQLPPTMAEVPFRSQQPPKFGVARSDVVAGPDVTPTNFMLRTPGGVGQGGREWAQGRSGFESPTAGQFGRPTEELYKQAFRPAEQVAPGAREAAGRELLDRIGPDPLEWMKAQTPVRQQEVAGQYGVEQERLKGEYGLRTEREKQEALRQGYETLRGFLGGQGAEGVEPGTSFSLSGVGSVRTPTERPVQSGLLRDVTAARQALESARSTYGGPMNLWGAFTDVDEQAEGTYKQALGAVFGQDPADALTKELALQIALDPELSDAPISQILGHPKLNEEWDLSSMTDEEIDDLDRLLNYARGTSGF